MAELLVFGAMLIAIILRVVAAAISEWTRAPLVVSLVAATTLVIAFFGLAVWLFGSQLSSQRTNGAALYGFASFRAGKKSRRGDDQPIK